MLYLENRYNIFNKKEGGEAMKTLRYVVLLLILLCLAAGPAHAVAIKLTAPNGGENWTIGTTQNITWTVTGTTAQATVSLELLTGQNTLGIIKDNIPAQQKTFLWTVGQYKGGTASAGTDYKVRVKVVNTSASDKSLAAFTISNISALPIMQKTWNNLSGLCYIVNCQGTATAPILKTVEGLVTPGGTLLIKGQGFGNSPGKVYMSPNTTGDYIISNMELPTGGWWNDNAILAVVPSKTGVKEQTVTIKVETAAYKVSNIVFATFKPSLNFIYLPAYALTNILCSGICSGLGGPFSYNDYPSVKFEATNEILEGWSTKSGDNTWKTHLKNGWVTDGHLYDWTVVGGGSANADNTNLTAGSSDLFVQINYELPVTWVPTAIAVGANVGVIGPKDVPFK
jgi:hypothetical protein